MNIQPRFKIQYPMKNRSEDIIKTSHNNGCLIILIFFLICYITSAKQKYLRTKTY